MNRRSTVGIFVFAALVSLLTFQLPGALLAAPPGSGTQLTFQARLTTSEGQPIQGSFALTFRIHDAPTGGAALWEERHDGAVLPRVTVSGGLLAVVLGQQVPLGSSVFQPTGGARRYVAVVLGTTEVARVELTASAYAVTASVTSAIWDASAGAALDLAALDQRFVRSGGTGGGVVRSVNGIVPTPAGDFELTAGNNVTLTPTANGLQIASSGGGGSGGMSQEELDARYLVAPVVEGTSGPFRDVSDEAHFSNPVVMQSLDARVIQAGDFGGIQLSETYGGGGSQATLQLGNVTMRSHSDADALVISGPVATGDLTVSGAGSIEGGLLVNGDLEVVGNKSFVADHPTDPTQEIVYVALEAGERGIYARGTAKLVDGVATIALPEHFALLAKAGSITVQVTPLEECNGLFVSGKSVTEVQVKELARGTSGAAFDYLVMAERTGPSLHVVRPRSR